MSHIQLNCSKCGSSFPANAYTLTCTSCCLPLDVDYKSTIPSSFRDTGQGLWSIRAPLPLHDQGNIVSLGEGQTPSITLNKLGKKLGMTNVYGKLEFQNPTASFKDRGTTVLISMLRELGVNEVVEDSSGNAGASLSAYAALADMVAHIFAPSTAPQAKIQQIMVYGAQTHLIDGPREASYHAALAYQDERGLCYASHNLSPYFLEGTKTFAYEVAQQFQNHTPKHIVMPVGNGSLLIGSWKGFRELREQGVISEIPKLHSIQAEAVQPIVAAFKGKDWKPQPGAKTVAGGISVAEPPRLEQVLKALKDTGGVALAVNDDNILKWQSMLAREEGIYAEPTSSAAIAGVEALVREGHVSPDESVLVAITGLGLKDVAPT